MKSLLSLLILLTMLAVTIAPAKAQDLAWSWWAVAYASSTGLFLFHGPFTSSALCRAYLNMGSDGASMDCQFLGVGTGPAGATWWALQVLTGMPFPFLIAGPFNSLGRCQAFSEGMARAVAQPSTVRCRNNLVIRK